MSLLKRIIFCLHYKEGRFYLSRNFRLQKVGDVDWLIRNFSFGKVTNYVDEIIIILVKKQPTDSDFENFFKDFQKKLPSALLDFVPAIMPHLAGNCKSARKEVAKVAKQLLLQIAAQIRSP